jgi:hypothetical protein
MSEVDNHFEPSTLDMGREKKASPDSARDGWFLYETNDETLRVQLNPGR